MDLDGRIFITQDSAEIPAADPRGLLPSLALDPIFPPGSPRIGTDFGSLEIDTDGPVETQDKSGFFRFTSPVHPKSFSKSFLSIISSSWRALECFCLHFSRVIRGEVVDAWDRDKASGGIRLSRRECEVKNNSVSRKKGHGIFCTYGAREQRTRAWPGRSPAMQAIGLTFQVNHGKRAVRLSALYQDFESGRGSRFRCDNDHARPHGGTGYLLRPWW